MAYEESSVCLCTHLHTYPCTYTCPCQTNLRWDLGRSENEGLGPKAPQTSKPQNSCRKTSISSKRLFCSADGLLLAPSGHHLPASPLRVRSNSWLWSSKAAVQTSWFMGPSPSLVADNPTSQGKAQIQHQQQHQHNRYHRCHHHPIRSITTTT